MFEKEAEEFERRKHYRYEDNDYCCDIADGIVCVVAWKEIILTKEI